MPHISRIVMKGFKSFARETEILLDRGMNVIVGANGSGKSNIVDALCFVLGRLSIKSMRADRAASLIYNGGKENKPADEARIDLIFDNSDRTLPMDIEVKITRIVRRDGASIYKINDETKTRQEMLDILAQANIDPYGFNIVLQGEISRLIDMHQEERRKIIEEVAGISVYEIRKEKSLRELEKTDQKLVEVRAVLNERFIYLKNLDKEREQALRYQRLQEAIKRDKASIIAKKAKIKKKEDDETKKKISSIDDRKKKLSESIEALKKEISSFNEKIETINKKIEDSTGIQQEKLHHELTEEKAELAVVGIKIESANQQFAEIEKRNFQLEEDIKHDKEVLEKLRKEKPPEKKRIDIHTFRKSVLQSTEEIDKILKKVFEFDSELLEETKKHKNMAVSFFQEGKIKEARNEFESVISLIDSHAKKNSKVHLEFESQATELRKIIQKEIGEEGDGRNILLEINDKERDIERMHAIIKDNLRQKEKLKNESADLEKKYKEKRRIVESKEEAEKKLYASFHKLFEERNKLHNILRETENKGMARQQELFGTDEENNIMKIADAKISAELENLYQELKQFEGIEIVDMQIVELEARLLRNQETLLTIGSVNMRALQVYETIREEYYQIEERVKKLEAEKLEILKIIEEIDNKKKDVFFKTLNVISNLFTENFSAVSDKGIASLELENKENPFAGGLDISIKLAKGKYLDPAGLSGGEQTLVALALIFAIHKYKPYSFYIFDEVDPALDKRNSEGLANLLKQNVKLAQYVIITHNDAVISAATTLYGVSMQDGVSKIISLKL